MIEISFENLAKCYESLIWSSKRCAVCCKSTVKLNRPNRYLCWLLENESISVCMWRRVIVGSNRQGYINEMSSHEMIKTKKLQLNRNQTQLLCD